MKIPMCRSYTMKTVGRLMPTCALLALTINAAHATIPPNERATLDALFIHTGSSAALAGSGWEGPSGSECSWLGITCTTGDDDHVGAIALSSLGLTGTLPDISAFTALESFDVSNNAIGGSLPALTRITTLRSFNASHNRFTGSIPSLFELRALQTFNVEENLLDGNAPNLLSLSALRAFLVGNNQLTGPAPIPPDPSVLSVASSSLCPNFLGPASTPESPTDLIWDDATDNTPWSEGCTAGPVVTATAVAAPTLSLPSLLALIGLFGIVGGILVRYRET